MTTPMRLTLTVVLAICTLILLGTGDDLSLIAFGMTIITAWPLINGESEQS